MRKISTNLVASLTAFLLMSPNWLMAQQAPQSRKWVAQNPKYITFSSDGIHFLPRNAKKGTDRVTTTLHLPDGQPWRVAFDVRMVPITDGSMSVHLTQGAKELCWLGAGDFHKSTRGYLGTSNGDIPLSHPWDKNWHSFAYESDGKTLSLWHNGNKCGETTLSGTPDTFTIQNIGMELRVRNVHTGKLTEADTPNINIPFFSENFINPKFIDHWNGSNNGGSVTIGEKGLKLAGNGKGYPILTSQGNPFPTIGNWTASFGYHYSSIGNYGTEIRCNRSNGDAVLLVHQDVHGQFLTLNNKTVWQSPPSAQWHVVSLVEKDNQFAAYMDGSQVGKDIADNRPVSFHIGGGLFDNPWDWNNLEIAFLKVNIGVHPLDISALNEHANPLQPLTHNTLSVASVPESAPVPLPVTPVPVSDTALARLNAQIDEHNSFVADGNKMEALKSQYLLAYQQCELAKDIADNSGQEGRYYQALKGMVQFSDLYDAACSRCDLIWSHAALLRSIIESDPLYTPTAQTKGTDVSVTVTVHSEN